jgi:hypothetical protein
MRQLVPCQACNRHHAGHETACPHCGVAHRPVRTRPVFVRNLKMGALLAFTAATTAACYGTPVQERPNARPSVETAAEKVPTKKGTAFLFVTPTGWARNTDTLQLEKAKLEGARLTIASVTVDFTVTLELPSADKLAAGTTLDLKDLKFLYAKARTFKDDEPAELVATLPGSQDVTGTLTLSAVTATTLSGTLIIQTPDGKLALYFFSDR